MADGEVDTRGKDVFLVGENGQGKTNFLEALYYCSYASSFRGAKDQELVRFGATDCVVSADVADPPQNAHDQVNTRIAIAYSRGKKTIAMDGKTLQDRKELLSVIPCVVFCHEDMDFISGTPESRRWFFDQTQSLYDPVYLEDLRRYRRILKTRNMVLKTPNQQNRALRESLDPQLIYYGLRVMEKRAEAVQYFSGIFEALYAEVSQEEGIRVQYLPSWKESAPEAVALILRERGDREEALGVSLSGPHRDLYRFVFQGRDFTQSASTGQKRLLALLLRIAQARLYTQMTLRRPVLLLDDALLELDPIKKEKFLTVMPEYDQAFYTFLPGEYIEQHFKKDALVYQVSQGNFVRH